MHANYTNEYKFLLLVCIRVIRIHLYIGIFYFLKVSYLSLELLFKIFY